MSSCSIEFEHVEREREKMRLSEAFNRFLVTNLVNSIMHSKYQIFIIICHLNYFKNRVFESENTKTLPYIYTGRA